MNDVDRPKIAYAFSVGEHTFVYRFWPGEASRVLRLIYMASRGDPGGFSLSYVLQAMRELG